MPSIICSLDNPRSGRAATVSPAEAIGVITTLAKLYGWNVDVGYGLFRGQKESCLRIEGHALAIDAQQAGILSDLLWAAGQETFLHIDARRRVRRYSNWSPGDRSGDLGVLEEIASETNLGGFSEWAIFDHHIIAWGAA